MNMDNSAAKSASDASLLDASNSLDPRLSKLIEWMRISAAPANGLLVPLSGGSDSALIFWLLNQAFPPNPAGKATANGSSSEPARSKIIGVHVGDNLRCREWFESVGTVRVVPKPTLSAGQDAEVMRSATVQSLCVSERLWLVGSRTRTRSAGRIQLCQLRGHLFATGINSQVGSDGTLRSGWRARRNSGIQSQAES